MNDWKRIEAFRKIHGPMGSRKGDPDGVFEFVYLDHDTGHHVTIHIIACRSYGGWEHVSVHAECDGVKRTPTWREMCRVKDLFWEADECVVQFHPPKADYVNEHPHVLHLWRATGEAFPMPPKIMV